MLHVEREAPFRAVQVCEPGLVIDAVGTRCLHLHIDAREARPGARLDLDDVTAEIAERLRRDRTDERPGKVEHPNTSEWSTAVSLVLTDGTRCHLTTGRDAHETSGASLTACAAPELARC